MLVKNLDTGRIEHKTIGKSHATLDSNWESVVQGLMDIDKKYQAKTKAKSTYRELQAQCKTLGLKASGKTTALENRLVRHAKGTLTESDYNKTKTKAKKERPSDTFGLSYRQAQRLVKWCKENVAHSDALPIIKNTGWDNIMLNIQYLCTTEHFRSIMSTPKNRKALTEYLGVKSQTFLQELGV